MDRLALAARAPGRPARWRGPPPKDRAPRRARWPAGRPVRDHQRPAGSRQPGRGLDPVVGVDEQGPDPGVELRLDGVDLLTEEPARVQRRRHRVVGAGEHHLVQPQVAVSSAPLHCWTPSASAFSPAWRVSRQGPPSESDQDDGRPGDDQMPGPMGRPPVLARRSGGTGADQADQLGHGEVAQPQPPSHDQDPEVALRVLDEQQADEQAEHPEQDRAPGRGPAPFDPGREAGPDHARCEPAWPAPRARRRPPR